MATDVRTVPVNNENVLFNPSLGQRGKVDATRRMQSRQTQCHMRKLSRWLVKATLRLHIVGRSHLIGIQTPHSTLLRLPCRPISATNIWECLYQHLRISHRPHSLPIQPNNPGTVRTIPDDPPNKCNLHLELYTPSTMVHSTALHRITKAILASGYRTLVILTTPSSRHKTHFTHPAKK